MRHLLISAALVLFSLAVFSQGNTMSAEQLYHAMNHAMLQADTAAIARMTTADFTLTHITGYRQSRAEWLQQIENGQMRYFNMAEESVQANVKGDTARAVGRSRTTAHIWGAQGTWPLQLDYQLVREKGEWKARQAVATTY